MDDTGLRDLFRSAGVGPEPPVGTLVSDALRLGRARTRRRHIKALAGFAAVMLVATGVPVASGVVLAAPQVLVPTTPQALAQLLIELRPPGYTVVTDDYVRPAAFMGDAPSKWYPEGLPATAIIRVVRGTSAGGVRVYMFEPGWYTITPCRELTGEPISWPKIPYTAEGSVESCKDVTTVDGVVIRQDRSVDLPFSPTETGHARHVSILRPDGVVIDMEATDSGNNDGFHQDDTIVMTFDQLAAAASDPRWGFSMDAAFVVGAAGLKVGDQVILD